MNQSAAEQRRQLSPGRGFASPGRPRQKILEPRSGERALNHRSAVTVISPPLRGSQNYCARNPRLAEPRLGLSSERCSAAPGLFGQDTSCQCRSSECPLARPRSCFHFCRALSSCLFRVGYYVDPLLVRRGLRVVVVVPVPPLVRRRLRVALRRVLPLFLTPERGHIKVAPNGPHRLVATAVDEISAEYFVTIANERVMAMPLVHAEVFVEAIGDGVPRHLPTHAYLHALDVRLRRA